MRQSLKATYDASVHQEQLLNERIAGLRNNELDLQSRSIRYNMLKRDVDTNRQFTMRCFSATRKSVWQAMSAPTT